MKGEHGKLDLKGSVKGLLSGYFKGLIARSRSAIVRLLGYCNMYRFLQKEINLQFREMSDGFILKDSSIFRSENLSNFS